MPIPDHLPNSSHERLVLAPLHVSINLTTSLLSPHPIPPILPLHSRISQTWPAGRRLQSKHSMGVWCVALFLKFDVQNPGETKKFPRATLAPSSKIQN